MATIYSERLFAKHKNEFLPFLGEVGLPEAIFNQPDIELPKKKYAELLELVGRKSNSSIGLTMGCNVEATDVGVWGHAMAAARDVAQMLDVMTRYLYVYAQSNNFRVDTATDRVVISYQSTIPKPASRQQDVEFALSGVLAFLRKLTGFNIIPVYLDFEHQRPAYSRLHSQFFKCKVRFEKRGNRIHLNKNVLDFPILSADQSLFRALKTNLASQLIVRSDEDDLVTKVNHLISVTLGEKGPDIKEIAGTLGMSHRTLQRKLADQGCVFGDMADSIRKTIAMEYVEHSNYSLTDIALMVGYSELSSLSRSFKRWVGKTPQQVRDSQATIAIQE